MKIEIKLKFLRKQLDKITKKKKIINLQGKQTKKSNFITKNWFHNYQQLLVLKCYSFRASPTIFFFVFKINYENDKQKVLFAKNMKKKKKSLLKYVKY